MAHQLQKVRYTHEALVDLIIANPTLSQKEMAAIFDRTPAWVGMVMASDTFQLRLAQRRGDLADPLIKEEIEARFKAITNKSLERLQEKLEAPAATLDPMFLVKAAELGMKSQGIGQPKQGETVVVTSEERLARLADRLKGLVGGGLGSVIEGSARDVSQG